jgi:ribonuclease Y
MGAAATNIVSLIASAAVGLGLAASWFAGRRRAAAALFADAQRAAAADRQQAQREADTLKKEAALEAREAAHTLVANAEQQARTRRDEIVGLEQSLADRTRALADRLAAVEAVERQLAAREAAAADIRARAEADFARAEQLVAERQRELQRVSGLSAEEARELLIRQIEADARRDAANLVKRLEAEARETAAERARQIITDAIQRSAAEHAIETTVSVVDLPSDDMKGRIIGREGRNIRALETTTGVELIIDDTPGAIILSSFDPLRREIARQAIERLIADGRIHPARIEEVVEKVRTEMEAAVRRDGEAAAFELGLYDLHPEVLRLMGRLKFRTSYGQNVLAHSIECAHLAAMMAEELGASPKTARRAALLHDIGKAVSHEIEGPHALVGGDLARRHSESEAVAHAMEAHHNEVEPQTVEAVIVQAADALSGARPGARGESLEQYVKRLRDLEQIATRHDGVDKVYAMQAGREIRVMVVPGTLDDDGAVLLSHEIAREIEKELEYPGQIKVTVIRESRATDYAR